MLFEFIGAVCSYVVVFGVGAYWAKKKCGSPDVSLLAAAKSDLGGVVDTIRGYISGPPVNPTNTKRY